MSTPKSLTNFVLSFSKLFRLWVYSHTDSVESRNLSRECLPDSRFWTIELCSVHIGSLSKLLSHEIQVQNRAVFGLCEPLWVRLGVGFMNWFENAFRIQSVMIQGWMRKTTLFDIDIVWSLTLLHPYAVGNRTDNSKVDFELKIDDFRILTLLHKEAPL